MKKEATYAHGLTLRQSEEINLRKLSGDLEMIDANMADSLQDSEFKIDYAGHKIAQHERHCFHVAMELRAYNQQTRARESSPMCQIFDKATWLSFKDSDIFKSYTSEIVHNADLEDKDALLVTLSYILEGSSFEKMDSMRDSEVSESLRVSNKAVSDALAQSEKDNETLRTKIAELEASNITDTLSDEPIGVSLSDITSITTIAEARSLYMKITMESPDSKWDLNKIKNELKKELGF